MNVSEKLDINEISDLYVMYNELFSVSLAKKDKDSAKKYFLKTTKFFFVLKDFFGSVSTQNQQLEAIKEHFQTNLNLAESFLGKLDLSAQDIEWDVFEQSVIQNDKIAAYRNMAIDLNSAGANVSAINYLKKSMRLNPQNFENYATLGNFYIDVSDYKTAIICFEEYNKFDDTDPDVNNILGMLYSKVDAYENFEIRKNYFKKAFELRPNFIEALRNLAITHKNAGEDENCAKIWGQILNLKPTADDYFNYAFQQLKLGNFEEGIKYWEYRFEKDNNPTIYPDFEKPKWNGKTSLSDKTILIQHEQGFGDSIQFSRYVTQGHFLSGAEKY